MKIKTQVGYQLPVFSSQFSAQTAADEVDDFQAVAVGEIGLRPFVAGDDVSVELYSYSVLFHS